MSKTYQKTSKKHPNFFKRNIYAILLAISVLVIAVIVTITLILGTRNVAPPGEVEPPPYIPTVTAPEWVMPVSNVVIGQEAKIDGLIWCRTLRQWRSQDGIDFLGAAGAEVYAIMDGTVASVQNTIMHGTVITINHKDGLVSRYKSLDATTFVQVGQTVKSGDRIGTMSDSKIVNAEQGIHLHLQMTQNGRLVDPMQFLPNGDK
ncbi:MAG: M23 family metallopeptidase [Firmicutes bacterium]|nr:M23 family metallopeptidase [Bacillota bacterium]